MARDFIKVDKTQSAAIKAQLLINYIEAVRNAYEMGKRVGAIMDHNNDGTNFADLETAFGLPTGTGSVVMGLVNAAIQDNAAKALTERVGG
jgi:hypothetical protein